MRTLAIIVALLLLTLLLLTSDRTPPGAPSSPPSPDAPPPDSEGVPAPEAQDPSQVVLEGRVLDRDTSAPLAGARVILSADEGEWETTTDDAGKFSFSVPRDASSGWWLEARREGYVTGSGYWSTEGEAPYATGRPPIRLAAYAATLAGRVVDLEDRPVPGARVHLSDGRDLRAGDDGRFGPVPVPTGRMGCYALSPDHPLTERFLEFAAGEAQEVTIVLGATDFVTGIVVDETGRPVPGARVGEWSSRDDEAVITDAEGRFRWPVAPGRTTELSVEKPGWIQEPRVPTVFAGSSPRLAIFRPLTVAGRVVSADGRPPPAGLHVAVGDTRDELRTDGSFRLTDLIPGHCLLEIRRAKTREIDILTMRHLWYAVHFLELQPGISIHDLTVRLPALVTRMGRFRDAITGVPIPGVRFLGVVSDANGRFRVPVKATQERQEEEEDQALADGYVPATFKLGAPDEETTYELVPTARIRCCVVDLNGRPVPGAWVRVHAPDDDNEWRGWADADGNASVQAPPGPVEIDICRANRGTASFHATSEVTPGAVLDLGTVTLTPREEHVDPVRIRVADEGGTPLPEARCEEVRADETGVLVVERHRIPLTVDAPGKARGFVRRIPAGVTEITVVLEPGGEVRGRVLDAAGRPMRQVYLDLDERWTMTDIRGRFEYRGLELGRTWLLSCRPGYWPHRVREVRAGDEVELRLPPRSVVRVRLTGRDAASGRGQPEFDLSDPTADNGCPFLNASYESHWRFDGASVVIDAPAGTLDLDFRMTYGGEAGWMRYAGIHVRAGRETVVDYAYPTPGRITGRVRTVDGEPIGGVSIRIADTRAQVGTTDEHGEIESSLEIDTRGHCLGLRHLRIKAEGFAPVVVGPHDLSGAVDVDVRMKPGVRFKGRIDPPPPDGVPTYVRLRHARGKPGGYQATEPDGRFDLGWTAPGPHRVEVWRVDRIPVRVTVAVTTGDEVVIDTERQGR